MPRKAGKYGRKFFNPEVPHLTFEKYLDPREALSRSGLPPVPRTQLVDYASEVTEWPMYLNDQIGDCTFASLGHVFGAMSRYGSGTEALFSDGTIQHGYSAVSGYVQGDEDTDTGCLCSDVLAYAKATGLQDTTGRLHKALGYAKLGNAADETLLGQVLDVFGTVYIGFNVQQVIEDEFEQGKPWTWQRGAEIIGGHCVNLQKRNPSSVKGKGVLDYVTWGALQPATTTWQSHAVEEAWAVVSQDWVNANGTSVTGLDLSQLLSDMQYV
jgi:hypothetical protein